MKPYILFDGRDISLFESLDGASKGIESPDVNDVLVTDAEGRIFQLVPEQPLSKSRFFVNVSRVIPVPSNKRLSAEEFTDKLRSCLTALGVSFPADATAPTLVKLVEEVVGY